MFILKQKMCQHCNSEIEVGEVHLPMEGQRGEKYCEVRMKRIRT